MNLFYLIIVFHIVILPAQSKLDSLNDLILQYENRVTSTTLELDSLQQILLNLHAKYAEERFLLLEKSFVRRINRAAFAGMWIRRNSRQFIGMAIHLMMKWQIRFKAN